MKTIKRILLVLLSVFLVAELLMLMSGKTYLNNVFINTVFSGKLQPDIDELELFAKNEVAAASPQPWPLSAAYNRAVIDPALMKQIEEYETVSFVVIRNDSLLYERYWEGYSDTSLVNSFSMAKSFIGTLIGCAIRDGLIKSVDEPVGNYLEAFREGDKAKVTIRHLLTMSSGIDFKEDYLSLLAWPAEAYYGDDVNALTLKAGTILPPGKVWFYKGGDTQLLGMILQKVTGKKVAEYASERLWKPMGAEHSAYWSLDARGMEKVSCCFYTNARDYARIAKLMMHDGSWNGVQLLDSAYVKDALKPAVLVDQEGHQSRQYGYQWWLMNHKGYEIFYARGIRGQYIFAIPGRNMIVVRLGHKRAAREGNALPEDIFVYLDAALAM